MTLPMNPTETQVAEAAVEAHRLIQQVRDRAFKDGGAHFTDAQIWQAIRDSDDRHPYVIAATLVGYVIERRPIPSADDVAEVLARHKPTLTASC